MEAKPISLDLTKSYVVLLNYQQKNNETLT